MKKPQDFALVVIQARNHRVSGIPHQFRGGVATVSAIAVQHVLRETKPIPSNGPKWAPRPTIAIGELARSARDRLPLERRLGRRGRETLACGQPIPRSERAH